MTQDPSKTPATTPSLISAETITRHVLLLASPNSLRTQDLTQCLDEIGAPFTTIVHFQACREFLREARLDIGALLIQTGFDCSLSKNILKEIQAEAPLPGLGFISVGEPPAKSETKMIRNAGVSLALWNPICEASVRFQINRAIHADRQGFGNRINPRVPTEVGCTVTVGARTKETLIYSLAEQGAFLATPRASMTGARLSLELRFPDGTISTSADVVYANVPGNLQRAGLPLGMGVKFDPLDSDDQKRVQAYIASCMKRLTV